MWIWKSTAGELWHDDTFIARGYSGFGMGQNDPALENVPNIGPIPRGSWAIGAAEYVDTVGPHGPFVLPLTAKEGTETFGREGFLIHGDSISHAGSASHGCIILPRQIREDIVATHDIDLEVVA